MLFIITELLLAALTSLLMYHDHKWLSGLMVLWMVWGVMLRYIYFYEVTDR